MSRPAAWQDFADPEDDARVFAALAVSLIIHAGHANTGAVFTPHYHNAKGIGSIVPGVLYAVFGIIGFEAAAPLSEEARNPRRTVPRAVVAACAGIGLFYLLCYYGITVSFGPAHMTGLVNFNSGDPWAGVAKQVWGLGFIVVIIALANSAITGSNASSVATTRVGYALGRIGMLPAALARISPRTRTPTIAVAVQAVFAIGFALGVGFALGGPLPALLLQGTISTVLIVVIYGIGGLGIEPLAYPASVAPWVIYSWVTVGLLVLGYFFLRHRERIGMTRLLFTGAPPEAAAPAAEEDAGAGQARWIRSSSLAVK